MRKYRRKTSKKIAKMKTKGSYVRVEKEKKRRRTERSSSVDMASRNLFDEIGCDSRNYRLAGKPKEKKYKKGREKKKSVEKN